jgi:hypothetical protein
MVDFRELILVLKETGIIDVVLPFLLFYSITFAILEKSKIFHIKKKETTQEGKKLNLGDSTNYVSMVVAFVVGIFGITFYSLVETIQELIAYSAVFIVFFLCILIILGMIFGEGYMEIFKNPDKTWNYTVVGPIGIIVSLIVIFTLLFIIGALDSFINWWDKSNDFDSTIESLTTFIFLVIIGMIIFLISREKNDNEQSKGKKKSSKENSEEEDEE